MSYFVNKSRFFTSLLIALSMGNPVAQAQASFSDDCSTYGFYAIDDWYQVQIFDKQTENPSLRCEAKDWEITGAVSGIGDINKSSSELKFKRLAGGNINVRATNGIEWTADNYLLIAKGENWDNDSSPLPSTTPDNDSVFLTIESLQTEGLQEVLSHYFSATGSKEMAIVFNLIVKNIGKRTFDPLEPDPLNPGTITTIQPWAGMVACGTLVNPITQEFEGLVFPPQLSTQQKNEAWGYLLKGDNLIKRVHNGEVLPCHINALSGYSNIQPDASPSELYEFDLYFNGSSNSVDIENFRISGEKRESTLKNVETGKRINASKPITKKIVPPAGYEDEVITTFDVFNNPFPDTNKNSLEGKAAAELYRRAVIGGFSDGKFKGERRVNRAEAAKFLLLTKNIYVPEVIADQNSFSDVIAAEWYGKYVIKASELGIIKGYSDGTFRPASVVQTDEFLAMLSRTFELQPDMPHHYKDKEQYPDGWFWKYAGVAEEYDIFPNRLEYLLPAKPLTRYEVAVALYQFLKNR